MSQLSQGYVNKVMQWSTSGLELEKLPMSLEQKFRARLCLECYRLFTENPSVPVRTIVKNIAARDYRTLADNARLGNQDAAEMMAALGISTDPATGAVTVRSETNISNDIWLVNQLVGRLNVSKKHIHKAMFESNIGWMMDYGRKTGTWQAVKQANQDLAKINNDFKDDDDPQEQMPNPNINITGDVSIVKGHESMTEEQKIALRKKYGLTEKELATELEEINGVWQATDDGEEEKDVFIENEQ